MANIINNLTPEGMVNLIDKQIEKIDTVGTDEMIRLQRDLKDYPDDPSQWFDYGIALNQAAMHRIMLLDEREHILHPDDEDIESDLQGSIPLLEQALKAFDHVLDMEPDYYGVQTQKGIVYGNMQRLSDAEQCYLQALQDDDEDFSAAYYLGLTYRDMGREDDARKYLALAHELNPDDETFSNGYGQAVEQ